MGIVSQKPFLIRAIHEWCQHNGFTPYLLVQVDQSVRVPKEYVQDNQIVLNVSYDATNALILGNELIELKARFGGRVFHIIVPIERVAAIYARENGQGMGFEVEETVSATAITPSETQPNAVAEPSEPEHKTPAVVLSLHTGGQSSASTDTPQPPTPPEPNSPTQPLGLRRIK